MITPLNKLRFCDLGLVVSLLYFFIAYSIVALLLMVLSDNREFSMMVVIFILIPILALLLLFTVTQTGKIAPNSVQNPQFYIQLVYRAPLFITLKIEI